MNLTRTLTGLLVALIACGHTVATSRLLQQDAAASDAALIDRTRPDWYVAMELSQQQQSFGAAAALMELESLATAPTSTSSVKPTGEEPGTATRAASLVRAAAAKKPTRKTPRRSRLSPPPKPSPRAPSPGPAPSTSPKPSPSPSPSPSPAPSPSPSPSPSPRSCIATASDVLGPFYQAQGVPLNTKPDESFCALKAGGRNTSKITITGKVLQSFTCAPVTGITPSSLAYIDVWQANNAGEYDDNRDTSDSECRSRVPIGPDGSYKYTTIVPAAYGSRTCLRPPHIHLRVALPGYAALVTQMYFAGNALNGPNDCGCSSCGSGNPLQQVAIDPATGTGVFDIILNRQR